VAIFTNTFDRLGSQPADTFLHHIRTSRVSQRKQTCFYIPVCFCSRCATSPPRHDHDEAFRRGECMGRVGFDSRIFFPWMAGHPCLTLTLRARSLSLLGDPVNIGKELSRPASSIDMYNYAGGQ
jgi:hypothetical protein